MTTTPTTEGVYRVLESTRSEGERDGEEWLLLEVETADPTYVPRGDLDAAAGNRVRATITWPDGDPRVEEFEVVADTQFGFTRTREPLFQDAHACWRDAREAGEAMASRVTHGTDGDPNGAVYTFAEQPGSRDLYEEFRDGGRPLDPLLARLAESVDPPFEVFVIDHTGEPFVVVLLAFEREGLVAGTVRETYFGERSLPP
ncbi:MAG: DUF6663 family protein [Haloarculaceae archaeon]